MKIVIFEPHPDDLLFGVGPIIFTWIEEGHEIHVITVTDGRACYRGRQEIEMSEDDVATMRIKEAKKTIEYLKLPPDNLHLLNFPDARARRHVKEGIVKVKTIIVDSDRLVIPSNHNGHRDHQATHDIAVGAARELNLDVEYFVYFIPSYGTFKEDSRDKQIEVIITDDVRKRLQEWLQIYQSQKITPLTWKLYTRFINRLRGLKYGIYSYKDMGKYHNF